jgi:hypothetical protein
MTLLFLCGYAVAGDSVSADKAPATTETKLAQPGVGKPRAPRHASKDERKAEPAAAQADAPPGPSASSTEPAQPGGGAVKMSGMSILGNEEAPKSLVIVPWKSSQLGDMPGVARLLDPSTQPVDKEVFMRELAYYEIRAKAK